MHHPHTCMVFLPFKYIELRGSPIDNKLKPGPKLYTIFHSNMKVAFLINFPKVFGEARIIIFEKVYLCERYQQ